MGPLHAHSPTEAEYYLKVTPCPGCGKGPWRVQVQAPEQDARTMLALCVNCGRENRFEFLCLEEDRAKAEAVAEVEGVAINPSSEPSRIIDVGQWLSLFYFLIESASQSPDKSGVRKVAFQAAQCVEEAMKFYGPQDDMPPESAFYTEASRQALARFPDRFSRRRLRDIRSRLPDSRAMARRLAEDAHPPTPPKKTKWRFWKK